MGEQHDEEWSRYRLLVMGNFERIDEDMKQLKKDVNDMKTSIATLKIQLVVIIGVAVVAGELIFKYLIERVLQ